MKGVFQRLRRVGGVERVLSFGLVVTLIAGWTVFGLNLSRQGLDVRAKADSMVAGPVKVQGDGSSGGSALPVSGGSASGSSSGAGSGFPDAKSLTGASNAGMMTVYVVGAVHRPGLYKLALDARVAQAIQGAGGALADADLAAINLAAVVEDGMEVVVPALGQTQLAVATTGGDGASGGALASGFTFTNTSPSRQSARGRHHHKHKLAPGERIDLNTANLEILEMLPGVGQKKAQAMIAYRQAHGLFTTLSDLRHVPGIGPKLLSRIESYLTL